jgi:hypothetical protein
MAIGLTRTFPDSTLSAKTRSFGAAGRRLALTSLTKSNMTQAELDACIQFISLTSSVTAIGSDQATENSAFVAGTSGVVYIISEGPAPVAGSNFGGVTGVTAAVTALYDQR